MACQDPLRKKKKQDERRATGAPATHQHPQRRGDQRGAGVEDCWSILGFADLEESHCCPPAVPERLLLQSTT